MRPTRGTTLAHGIDVSGYEIHSGRSSGPALDTPFCVLEDGTHDGAVKNGGRLIGTYLHGLFSSNEFRRSWLEGLRSGRASTLDYEHGVEQALDALADGVEAALDVDALFGLAR